MKKDIDWKRAPKGTTHAWWIGSSRFDWEKWEDGEVYHWRKYRGWVYYGPASLTVESARIKKPEENTMNTNSLEHNIERMQKELDEMKAKLNEKLNEKQKWEPKGGGYLLTIRGHIRSDFGQTPDGHNDFGMCFQTEEQAEIASKLMRERNRIIQYVLEQAPNWKFEFEYDIHNHYVYYSYLDEAWAVSYLSFAEGQHIFMPGWVAKKLTDDLNSGRVVL